MIGLKLISNQNIKQLGFKGELVVKEDTLSNSQRKSKDYQAFQDFVERELPPNDKVNLSRKSGGLLMDHKATNKNSSIWVNGKNKLNRLLKLFMDSLKDFKANGKDAFSNPDPNSQIKHPVVEGIIACLGNTSKCLDTACEDDGMDWLGFPIDPSKH